MPSEGLWPLALKRKAVSDVSEIADEYRRKAEACRRLADISPEPNRKAHWIQQATDWERLAADALKQSRRKQRTEALTS
jgi:hypothetical protein